MEIINDDVEVIGYCLTYNHAKYIRDALEGFVNQKTSFKYKIIVHDDASTDGTADIIMEYANKYPDIIIPVIQDENQYSKGVTIFTNYILPLIKGKYVTICEGDDYWCDERKLQKQYDILEGDSSLVACTHNTAIFDEQKEKKKVKYSTHFSGVLPLEKVIEEGGSCFHTSSLMYRREYVDIPEGFNMQPVGDYPRAVYLALCGGIFYLPDVMSVYRVNVKGSWTKRQNDDSRIKNLKKVINMLSFADGYSKNQYHELFYEVIKKKELLIYYYQGCAKEHLREYKSSFRKMNSHDKKRIFFSSYLPFSRKLYLKVMKKQ